MASEAKSKAMKKMLGNVIECKECGSKKHKTKEHGRKDEGSEKENTKKNFDENEKKMDDEEDDTK